MTKRHRPRKPDLVIVLVGTILSIATAWVVAEDAARPEAPGPLSSPHAELEDGGCDSCHGPGNAVLAENCLVCHDLIAGRIAAGRGVHREVSADGNDCVLCHVEHGGRNNDIRAFETHGFDHQEETGFSLDDDHAAAAGDCSNCHTGRSFLSLDPDCATCHSQAHGGDFLAGSHASLECTDCHPVAGISPALEPSQPCAGCHEDVHEATLGTDCTLCHSPVAPFRNASRDFHKETLLPLEGRHLAVPCAECHWNGQLAGTPTRCYDCHWIRRQDDRFRTALGIECENCHRPISWTAVTWDHAAVTGQPLGAVHFGVACQSCHTGGQFDGPIPFNCVECHLSDYQSANDPNHQASGFPTDCEICHNPSRPSWEGASFNHSTFPLVGSHAALDCSSCHSSGVYNGLPSECVDCHLSDYQSTDDPNHQAAGFPTDCEICHSPSRPSWEGASVAHSTFPLVGSHAALDCSSCHSSGVYNGLPSECVDCHLSDYQSTDDPNHQAAGFPTDCEICHSPSRPSWEGASVAHSTFPLVGSHAALDCSSCHSSGVYNGLPSECVDCHLSDYQSTDDPNHQAAGFPTDCEICHRAADSSWSQGDFDHVWFPIDSGTHRNFRCSRCHTSDGNYAVFSCTSSCHPRSDTNEDHEGESGYIYDSAACYSCHPDGQKPEGDR